MSQSVWPLARATAWMIATILARLVASSGPKGSGSRALAAELTIPVIASGGVTRLDDIEALLTAEEDGVTGAVIGRALYEGTIDLAEARKLVNDRQSKSKGSA